jgi:hypothetical protein
VASKIGTISPSLTTTQTTGIRLANDKTITSSNTSIFGSFAVGSGECWQFEAYLRYKISAPGTDIYFSPPPGTSSGYTRLMATGQLWYNNTNGVKTMNIGTYLSNSSNDGGPAVTIAAANTYYTCTMKTTLNGTAGQANVSFQALTDGAGTATLMAGSYLLMRKLVVSDQ